MWRFIAIAMAAVGLLLATSSVYTSDCDVNCSKKCYKKRWGIKYDDPACRTACEARKGFCRATDRSLPDVPWVTDPSIIPPDPRELYYQQCAIPFQNIVAWTRATCKNDPNRMDNRAAVQSAIEILHVTRLFKFPEFDNVNIRWCKLSGAHGMAPAPNEIYLDESWMNAELPDVAALLAHEMQHRRQWLRHGEGFACKYSEAYLTCNGCQDNGNRFEKEAYATESRVYAELNKPARVCETNFGKCSVAGSGLYVGMLCQCGFDPGRAAVD